jgi:hypothetical protein
VTASGEASLRPVLDEMAAALRELHRLLIEAARKSYEEQNDTTLTALELLGLLKQHTFFRWLQPLTEIIVDLDMLLEEDVAPSADELNAIRVELERLVTPPPDESNPSEFWTRYVALIQSEPAVGIAHGRVQLGLRALPKKTNGNMAARVRDEHRWGKIRAGRKRP